MLRPIGRFLSIPVVWLLRPVKLFAWRTRFSFLRRLILEITSAIDAVLIVVNVQNHTMLLHQAVYGGNFLFGKSVMVTSHDQAAADIPQARLHISRFMGVHAVVNDAGAFASNAAPITTSQPARGILREHMNREFFTVELSSPDPAHIAAQCAPILAEWAAAPDMAANLWSVRGAATRIVVKVLGKQDISREQADAVTAAYLRRLAEFSLFSYYFPFMLGLLGTREGIRRQAFAPLQRAGLDNLVIDMTLFAAMLSIGTIVMKCVEFSRTLGVNYAALSPRERAAFVIEAERLHPTVTTVHRLAHETGSVEVCGHTLQLQPGDEVAYPFVCINRDAAHFANPALFDIGRPPAEVAKIMSWSRGPHACPVRNLSVVIAVLMLDAIAARHDLRMLQIFDLEV